MSLLAIDAVVPKDWDIVVGGGQTYFCSTLGERCCTTHRPGVQMYSILSIICSADSTP
jgi:hypothetical protein